MAEGMRERSPGVWEIRVEAGRDVRTGRTRQVSRTIRGSQTAAKKARAKLLMEVDEGRAGTDGTVATLLERWLDLIDNDRSPTTMNAYRAVRTRYLVPALGNRPVHKVTTDELDAIYTAWSRGYCAGRCEGKCAGHTKLSPATVRYSHAILHRAFVQAQRWGWRPTNPAAGASIPRGDPKEIEPPTPGDVRTLIDEATRRHQTELAVMIRLAAATGARRGELCGLRWADLDETPGALRIRRAIVVDAHGELIEKTPKTRKGRRIALDAATRADLEVHRAAMAERAALNHTKLHPAAFVFSDDLDGIGPWRPDRVTLAYSRLLKHAKLTGRFHDVRHLHATQLITAGVDPVTVAGRLGHTDPSTTLRIYSAWVPAADKAAAATIGGLLDG